MPWSRNAPIMTAVAALPGMPSVSKWIMAPPVEPLTELSEATRPPAWPVPNSSGVRESCFSRPYDTNDDTVAPAPARPPTAIPTAVPRASGPRSGQSASSGSRGTARAPGVTAAGSLEPLTIWSSTSPMAKSPMSTVTKSTPVLRNGMPKVKRSTPYWASVPMVPRNIPAKSETSAAAIEDWPSTDTLTRTMEFSIVMPGSAPETMPMVRPTTIIRKLSGWTALTKPFPRLRRISPMCGGLEDPETAVERQRHRLEDAVALGQRQVHELDEAVQQPDGSRDRPQPDS